MNLERILVAVDGSANGARAVEWATALASVVGAEVIAIHAVGLLEQIEPGPKVPAEPNRDEIRRRFETVWCAPLDREQVRSRRLLCDGNAVLVLLDEAERHDVDLIVVGSRGLGGYPEQLLGSTSTQVAQHSTRPVVIVPSRGSPTAAPSPV